jgi:hypothetical protein
MIVILIIVVFLVALNTLLIVCKIGSQSDKDMIKIKQKEGLKIK